MPDLDLYQLRENFNHNRIMLCFNGPISHSLIQELGSALKNYLEADSAHPSSAMDVFAIYIEMTQNIRHYATARGYNDLEASATVVVARDENGHYIVEAGNVVEAADGEALLVRVKGLEGLNSDELKAAYKEQRRKPRDPDAVAGAGLGIIDMARKSALPLRASAATTQDGRTFFSLRAVI